MNIGKASQRFVTMPSILSVSVCLFFLPWIYVSASAPSTNAYLASTKADSIPDLRSPSILLSEITLEKVMTAQRVYEDMITEKGAHTRDFKEAARDAYKKITPKIINLVTENIK